MHILIRVRRLRPWKIGRRSKKNSKGPSETTTQDPSYIAASATNNTSTNSLLPPPDNQPQPSSSNVSHRPWLSVVSTLIHKATYTRSSVAASSAAPVPAVVVSGPSDPHVTPRPPAAKQFLEPPVADAGVHSRTSTFLTANDSQTPDVKLAGVSSLDVSGEVCERAGITPEGPVEANAPDVAEGDATVADTALSGTPDVPASEVRNQVPQTVSDGNPRPEIAAASTDKVDSVQSSNAPSKLASPQQASPGYPPGIPVNITAPRPTVYNALMYDRESARVVRECVSATQETVLASFLPSELPSGAQLAVPMALQLLLRTHLVDPRMFDLRETCKQLVLPLLNARHTALNDRTVMQPRTGDAYKLIGLLGGGAFSWAFHATNRNGAHVAIKIINKARYYHFISQGAVSMDAPRKMLATEIEILRLNCKYGVPGLAQSLASWSDLCYVYIVMPLYFKCTKTFESAWPCRDPRFQYYAAQLIAALGRLHATGYMHQDIKPDNILVTASGHLVISDFGLAMQEANKNQTPGSGWYTAPEVWAKGLFGDSLWNEKADIWSLGVVLLEIFARSSNPWRSHATEETSSEYILRAITQDPAELPDMKRVIHYDYDLHDLLLKMLQRDPQKRASLDEIKGHGYFANVTWDNLDKWAHDRYILFPKPDMLIEPGKCTDADIEQLGVNVLNGLNEDVVSWSRHDPYWTHNGYRSLNQFY